MIVKNHLSFLSSANCFSSKISKTDHCALSLTIFDPVSDSVSPRVVVDRLDRVPARLLRVHAEPPSRRLQLQARECSPGLDEFKLFCLNLFLFIPAKCALSPFWPQAATTGNTVIIYLLLGMGEWSMRTRN